MAFFRSSNMQLACVALLVLVFASHVNVLAMQDTLNEPDFMNARVPYILPVPGTDTVCALFPAPASRLTGLTPIRVRSRTLSVLDAVMEYYRI